jgi:2-haloacid dehalogenase
LRIFGRARGASLQHRARRAHIIAQNRARAATEFARKMPRDGADTLHSTPLYLSAHCDVGFLAEVSVSTRPKALLFDIFGTVFDWRGSIIEEGLAWGKARGLEADWPRFANAWRAGYRPALDRVRRGEAPWAKLDVLHRENLERLLPELGLTGMTEAEREDWNRVWHRLKPWPEAVPALARIRTKYTTAPLSNGNFSLLTALSKHAGISWDAIISVELAKRYKPDAEAYLTAVDLLDLRPSEAMLVAAHFQDLDAGRECGLQTAFVYRPTEYGPGHVADKAAPGQYDIVANDLAELATQLET